MTDGAAVPGAPQDWQRLDPRMLLVHPVRETVKFLPVLLGLLVAGTASGARGWQLLGFVVPVAVGLLRYLTTSYRVGGGRVELRRGLLERHVLSTPVDRVRTVDLTASPVHRVLGLVTVRVGTGTASTAEDERLDLDGLRVEHARRLREELLRAAAPTAAPSTGATTASAADAPTGAATGVAAAPPVLTFDPTWARFAPLTSTGVVITAGLVGGGTQLLDAVGGLGRLDTASWADRVAGVPVLLAAAGAVLGLAVATSVLAVGGYLIANWGFTLGHADRAWHLRRGLLTTRETSLDDARLAGVTLGEPLGLRAAGGGRLAAIATGLGAGQSSALLVPPAPRPVVEATARAVLGVAGPVDVPLVRHGCAAARRRWTRALGPAVLVSATCLVLAATRSAWWLVPVVAAPLLGAALGADRVRSLGHALVEGYVVSRSGSLYRRRDVLDTDAVIGWNLRATWFQRRAGLVTLVATTAGGRQAVVLLDVPAAEALVVATGATPGLVDQFLADRRPTATAPPRT